VLTSVLAQMQDPRGGFVELPHKECKNSRELNLFARRRWMERLGADESRLGSVKDIRVSKVHFRPSCFNRKRLVRWKQASDSSPVENCTNVDSKRFEVHVPDVVGGELRKLLNEYVVERSVSTGVTNSTGQSVVISTVRLLDSQSNAAPQNTPCVSSSSSSISNIPVPAAQDTDSLAPSAFNSSFLDLGNHASGVEFLNDHEGVNSSSSSSQQQQQQQQKHVQVLDLNESASKEIKALREQLDGMKQKCATLEEENARLSALEADRREAANKNVNLFRKEIETLQTENTALKKQLEAIRDKPGIGKTKRPALQSQSSPSSKRVAFEDLDVGGVMT